MDKISSQDYYSEKLAGERLRACYDLATPRVEAYLEAEIEFVLERTHSSMRVLELGCGYGRVLKQVRRRARSLVGIDTSFQSLRMAREFLEDADTISLAAMNALFLGFPGGTFDLTFCIQNGVSAFKVDQERLIGEAVRVTRQGGSVLFSSYSERFWAHRLDWFEAQAAHGLIGPIDHNETKNGVIVCKDGFRATTVNEDGFRKLASNLGLVPNIAEVDDSSLFCEIMVP